jgi:glycine betaine/proline transport system substrate-binding protein
MTACANLITIPVGSLLPIFLYSRAQLLALICGVFIVTYSAFLPAAQHNASQPIRIVTNDWSSQIVLAHIAGGIFEHLGYQIEYSSSTVAEQWGAMALGIDHVQVEVWEGTMSDMFTRMVAAGRLVDAGSHAAITREEWWYPDYVEQLCPGLPDWQALKACSALFSEDGSSTGKYFAGPWEKPEAARVRALGMDFNVSAVVEADQLWQALEEASQQQRAIVLFNWTPNWVEARYKGKFVEFPAHAPACETDPAWGINPDFHYDCGNPAKGWLKKAAWSGMQERWPCAYQTLNHINFENLMIAQLAARVDVDGMTHEAAAKEWLKNNQRLWLSWIDESCSETTGLQ